MQQVREAPAEELLIFGRLGPEERTFRTRPLVVIEAYRGLPGEMQDPRDLFYRVTVNDPPIVCITAPCNNNNATLLNQKAAAIDFTRVSVERVLQPFVDAEWLVNRIERGGALVAGRFVTGRQQPGGPETVLLANQVFLRLPERPGPCPERQAPECRPGTVATFDRDPNRCVLPTGVCERTLPCTLILPVCSEGYELVSWPSTGGCPAYACDPAFAVEPRESRCATVRCAAGFHCEEEGPEVCVPNVTCAAVLCPVNTRCVEENGDAECVPILTCASVLCAAGTRCIERNGQPVCVPTSRR